MSVLEDFLFWTLSVVEDEPIPFEVKHIYFCLNLRAKTMVLSFGGREQLQNPLFDFEYYPLEAQYFSNFYFAGLEEVFTAKILTKELLEKSLERSNFKKEFKNKYIYICELGKTIDYTFKT